MTGEPIRPQPKPAPRPRKLYAGLKRTGRLRARGNTSHSRRPRDFAWMGRVAQLSCIVGQLAPATVCYGRTEVDHAFGRYVVDSDRKTIPLCTKHHAEKSGTSGQGGFFRGWSLAQRRGWLEVAIAITAETLRGMT